MLGERQRVELQPNARGWIDRALEQFPIREAPLNIEIALKSREIDLPHQDPADRFLAATTLIYQMTLLTVDTRLTDADWLQTMSR